MEYHQAHMKVNYNRLLYKIHKTYLYKIIKWPTSIIVLFYNKTVLQQHKYVAHNYC